MMRFAFILILLGFFSSSLYSQSITCPPDREAECYGNYIDTAEIIDGQGLDLRTELEYFGNNCDTFQVQVHYILSDTVDVASCTSMITVFPFRENIIFPPDTTLYNYRLSEVYKIPLFTDQMFPTRIGECNIEYTFEDIIVESYPNLNVFRSWTATNTCSGDIVEALQHIKLRDIPNNGITTQVEDCLGNDIQVDSVHILFQGQELDIASCMSPYDSIHQILNCLAAEYLVEDTDELELQLDDIYNPVSELSTFDLIFIQRHILGIRRFETPCQLYAADVNRDGRINGIDLVELRKMILGIYQEWPYGFRPMLTINGVEKKSLTFTKADFPLPELSIVLAKQGNVTRSVED